MENDFALNNTKNTIRLRKGTFRIGRYERNERVNGIANQLFDIFIHKALATYTMIA